MEHAHIELDRHLHCEVVTPAHQLPFDIVIRPGAPILRMIHKPAPADFTYIDQNIKSRLRDGWTVPGTARLRLTMDGNLLIYFDAPYSDDTVAIRVSSEHVKLLRH